MRSSRPAPAPVSVGAGAVVSTARRSGTLALAATLVLATGACDRVNLPGGDDGPRVIELAHDTIRLAPGTRLVEVSVRRSETGDFEPAQVNARQNDYVRFTAGDRGGHNIVFPGDALEPDAHEFLQRTGQLRSPPLITDGAQWIITLDGAPAGTYPFRCTTHDVGGSLTVEVR